MLPLHHEAIFGTVCGLVMVFAAVGTYKKFFETRMVDLNRVAYPTRERGDYIVSRKSFPKRALSWHQRGGRSLPDKNCSAPKAYLHLQPGACAPGKLIGLDPRR